MRTWTLANGKTYFNPPMSCGVCHKRRECRQVPYNMFGQVMNFAMCRECARHNDGRGFLAVNWPEFPPSAMKEVKAVVPMAPASVEDYGDNPNVVSHTPEVKP